MAITPNTLFSSGAVYTAQQANNFPRGVMAQTTRTAGDYTMTTSIADVTGMSVTWTVAASRSYKISWTAACEKTTASGLVVFQITNASNAVAASTYASITVVGAGYGNLSGCVYLSGLTAGSITYKMRANVDALNGKILASGNNPCIMIVEDIGTA